MNDFSNGGPSEEGWSPLVSVVIPCYNQAHFLGEAIESALGQEIGQPFEVVVVDDGSKDGTRRVAEGYAEAGVRSVRQANLGLAAARNAGLRATRGTFVVFLDADDRLLPGALEAGLRCLLARPECAFAFGYWQYIAFDGLPLPTLPPPRVDRDHYVSLLRGNYIANPATVMYRRTALESIGGFDVSLSACADYASYLRLAREQPVCFHGELVAQYRRHESQMTRDTALMLATSVATLRSQLEYVKGSERHEKAYKVGLAYWYRAYAGNVPKQILRHAREREWGRAMRALLVLVRYPRALRPAFWRVRRKLARLVRTEKPGG